MEHNGSSLVVDDRLIHLVVFNLDEQRFALPFSDVTRIIRVVEITNLPEAPEVVLGVINIQGQIVPVINLRERFHLPKREISLNDQLIIAHTSERSVALLVDAVIDVIERSEQQFTISEEILPGLKEYIGGVAKLEDGIILICDLAQFLSLDEKEILNAAMEEMD
jgi:purine-binding chemotaxis protein CheW